MEKRKKLRRIFKILKKVLKPKQIILLIVLFAGNTYAWFIYSRQVTNSVDVHVRAWNILLEAGETSITSYFDVDIPNVFPGMENFSSSLTAYNRSDVAADLTYSILEARIFNDEYISVEGRALNGEDPVEGDMTSAELETFLSTSYPFTMTFEVTTTQLDPEYGEAVYTVSVEWPYESGDDAADTQYGIEAYGFKEANPSLSCIKLKIIINISQSAP